MLPGFEQFIDTNGLIGQGNRILLAVSGGVDSVVMAHLFMKGGFECGVAHCNFQLRGAESDADEEFVRTMAAGFEMPVFVRRFDVDREVRDRGISVQMAARDLRYEWFEELAQKYSFDLISTAHNLNDSVETFFLNLARGTGIRGLTGIPVKNGKVIRPLLFATRRQVDDYARKNRLAYREDSSNRETKYQRNKIRHDVIPAMEQISGSFTGTMASNMKRLEEVAAIFTMAVDRVREEIFEGGSEGIQISIGSLKKLVPMKTWLFELFSPFGFTGAQCEGIEQIMNAESGSRSISPGFQLYKDRDHLILVGSKPASFERYYLDRPEHLSLLPFSMDVEVLDREELAEIPADRNTACLDYDEIEFPLTIRHWLHGDYFYPLGMDQIKKLSDFFVDEKVPVPEKDRKWILATGRKIVWIMGHRIDNRFRITGKTRRILLLRFHPEIAAKFSEELF
jgi:tRNA(Ile)-lysidine synthase